MKNFKFLIIIFVFSFLIFNRQPVFGAEIFFNAPAEVGINQDFKADVFIDTRNEPINAVEGSIVFPRGILGIKEISTGNSVVNFWIQSPKMVLDNKIIFSGIIASGYNGKGKIFSVVFQSLKEGDARLEFGETKVFLNDGQGTPAELKTAISEIKTGKNFSYAETEIPDSKDNEPPESFEIYLSDDKNVFGGKWFVVFAGQDKKSGIDRYEVAERRPGFPNFLMRPKWNVGESPYLLADQELKSDIYVKAIDKAGNRRIQSLSPYLPAKWYKNLLVWITIMIVIISVCLVWRKKFFKRKKYE